MNVYKLDRNRNFKISKVLLKSQAHQGTSLLFTSAGKGKGWSREAQVRYPEGQSSFKGGCRSDGEGE